MKCTELIIIALLLIIWGCNNKNEEQKNRPNKKQNYIPWACNMKKDEQKRDTTEVPMNYYSSDIHDLKTKILQNGDTNAYNELDIAFLDTDFSEEFLIYAMVMANKYNYPQAYFDVFTCLTDTYLPDINKIDEETAALAIEYLLKANEKGHHQAKEIVKDYSIVISNNNKQLITRIFKE